MTDSPSSTADDEPGYRIGAVCRMTGISQHVLRVWEKRYAAVEPARSDTRRRLYSEADVSRLMRLKTLVDRGHAIGSIAGLDDAELERRIQDSAGARLPVSAAEKPAVALFGEALGAAADDCRSSPVFESIGHYRDLAEFAAAKPARRLDVAVVEWPSLYPDSAPGLTRLAGRLDARLLVVVYGYASRAAVQRLPGERMVALRSPLDVAALEAVVGWRFAPVAGAGAVPDELAGAPPARQFDDRELAYLAAQSPAIACECPMHLAQLIASLVNFEAYSAECESRNAEDAALHAYLHKTTSRARAQMEQALERVVELENLALPADDRAEPVPAKR